MKNKGFSLVEVIVAVSILAIISIPIIRSFTIAARTNSKAQMTQDATSLSEDVMEKIKSTSIEDLYKESTGAISTGKIGENAIVPGDTVFYFGDPKTTSDSFTNNPPYTIEYSNISATGTSIKYDAEVYISTEEYSQTNALDASDANTFEVPDLKNVNTTEHLVLSWEINEYDKSAVDRLVDENATSTSERATMSADAQTKGTKTTRIELSPVTEGSTAYVKANVYVSYEIAGYPNAVEFLAYTGTIPESTVAETPGPNLYLFYSTVKGAGSSETFKTEKIIINDTTESSAHVHNVYVILQDNLTSFQDGSINIELQINGTDYKTKLAQENSNVVPLNSNGAKLYTNARYLTAQSNMYDSKSRDRIYYVTVTVYKNGDHSVQYAKLTSTMETGKEADN